MHVHTSILTNLYTVLRVYPRRVLHRANVAGGEGIGVGAVLGPDEAALADGWAAAVVAGIDGRAVGLQAVDGRGAAAVGQLVQARVHARQIARRTQAAGLVAVQVVAQAVQRAGAVAARGLQRHQAVLK